MIECKITITCMRMVIMGANSTMLMIILGANSTMLMIIMGDNSIHVITIMIIIGANNYYVNGNNGC